jgi:hypothetical protein
MVTRQGMAGDEGARRSTATRATVDSGLLEASTTAAEGRHVSLPDAVIDMAAAMPGIVGTPAMRLSRDRFQRLLICRRYRPISARGVTHRAAVQGPR